MKIRGLGKKGQEAVSNFGVTGIILIVFLVVVVLGIWYVNSIWNNSSDQIPKNAEIIAQACAPLARESTINSYCFQFREVEKNKYTTCDYAKNYNIIIRDSDGSNVSVLRMEEVCLENSQTLNNTICIECNTSDGEFYGKSNVVVNGKKCSDWLTELNCPTN